MPDIERSSVNAICDVCGVEYTPAYNGPCQEPRPPYDGSRTCPGTVSIEAAYEAEVERLREALRGVLVGLKEQGWTVDDDPVTPDTGLPVTARYLIAARDALNAS